MYTRYLCQVQARRPEEMRVAKTRLKKKRKKRVLPKVSVVAYGILEGGALQDAAEQQLNKKDPAS